MHKYWLKEIEWTDQVTWFGKAKSILEIGAILESRPRTKVIASLLKPLSPKRNERITHQVEYQEEVGVGERWTESRNSVTWKTSWQLKDRKREGCLAYLVCPLKSTCIAECPWSIWPTTHRWRTIFTHTTMVTLSRTNNPKKKSSRKKHWSLAVMEEAVAVTRGWSTKNEKKC